MRFEELTFDRVGMWKKHAPLRLGSRLTIVLGDNEAGKSTSMRAIDALLFGADSKLVAPLTSVVDFDASARVRLMDGSEFGWRRKGRKAEPDDAALKLAVLAPPEQRSTFQSLFRLGHGDVRADPKFLTNEGALGRVLFAAESGASAASLDETDKKLKELEKAAESGAKAGNGLKRLTAAYKEALSKHKDRASFSDYDRTHAGIEAIRTKLEALKEEISQARERKSKLEDWRDGLAHAEARQDALDRLALLEGAGHLATRQQAQAIREALAALDASLEQQKQRAATVEAVEGAVRLLPPVPPVAAHAAEVESLAREVAGNRKDRESLDAAKTSLTETSRKLRELLASTFELATTHDTLLSRGKALVVSPVKLRDFQTLIEEGEKAEGEFEAAGRATEEAFRKSQNAREAADASAELSTDALSHALEAVRELKALDERLDTLETQRLDAAAKARELARGLGLAALDEPMILKLDLPSRQRLSEVFKRLETARRQERTAQEKRDEAVDARTQAASKEKELRDALSEPATNEVFLAARQAREAAWQQVKSSWTPWRDGAQHALPTLGAAFEELMHEVDQLADSRFRNATLLGQLSTAKELHEGARGHVEEADILLAKARLEATTTQEEWLALWPFLAAAPDDHVDWLNRFEKLIESLNLAARASEDLTLQRAKRQAHRDDAASLLVRDLPDAAALDTAAALQSAIQKELERRERHNADAVRKKSERDTLEQSARDAADRHREKEAALEKWLGRWNQKKSELPDDLQPERAAVKVWLTEHEKLAQLCRTFEKDEGDIRTRTAEIEAFDSRVRALLDRVRADEPGLAVPSTLPPVDALAELSKLAQDARNLQVQREKKQKDLDHALQEAQLAAETGRRRQQDLVERWREGGFIGDWTRELIDHETSRADEAHAERERIKQEEKTLRSLWKTDLAVALAGIDGRSEEALGHDAQREEETIAALETERVEQIRKQSELEQTKKSLESDSLADLEQELVTSRDKLFDKANELATLKAAVWLLAQARQKASKGAAPLIELASGNFAQLTGGEYEALEIDRESDDPKLRAIPTHGDSKKADELSDGTLDQLWLALRLAVVQQAAKKTPWPLVLDDVFVHFDDQRTTHALTLLARLSEQVQVIVFTHHDHVVDLARQAIPEALEVVVLTRPEQPRERLLPEVRERHERPEAPAAVLPERKGTTSSSDASVACDQILSLLGNASAPMGKGDLVSAIEEMFGVALSDGEWNKAINALVGEGRVVKEGAKRGVKYSLAQTEEATAIG